MIEENYSATGKVASTEPLDATASKELFSSGILVADGDEGYSASDAIHAKSELVRDAEFLFEFAGDLLTTK
jgi:hypothetical protein